MSEIVGNRSEILFYYDVKDANPNGDPLDENKPRIDTETGKNQVSDVRIKRTIRDYFIKYKGYDGEKDSEKDVLIREIRTKGDKVVDMKSRAKNFGNSKDEIKENILKKCIDVRLFGGTIALKEGDKGGSITLTGPVQFNMLNSSKHKVSLPVVGHSFTMSSGEGKSQGSLASEYIVPYSFLEVYGIINENAAKDTLLTKDDVKLLMEGLWNGTKNLISRSKFGQMPRLLVKIDYAESGYHIGDLSKMVKLRSEKNDEEIRGVEDFKLDVTELIQKLEKNKSKIFSVEFTADPKLNIVSDGNAFNFNSIAKAIEY